MSLKSEKIDKNPSKIDTKIEEVKPKIEEVKSKIDTKIEEVKPKIEEVKSKIDTKIDKKKSNYVKKGYNPNSKENLQVKSKKIEDSLSKIDTKSNVSFPKNSNFMLYLGIVVGIIAVTTGVYFAWSYLKNKKSKKIEEKSIDTNSIPDINNLSDEELERLQKISDAMENFEE